MFHSWFVGIKVRFPALHPHHLYYDLQGMPGHVLYTTCPWLAMSSPPRVVMPQNGGQAVVVWRAPQPYGSQAAITHHAGSCPLYFSHYPWGCWERCTQHSASPRWVPWGVEGRGSEVCTRKLIWIYSIYKIFPRPASSRRPSVPDCLFPAFRYRHPGATPGSDWHQGGSCSLYLDYSVLRRPPQGSYFVDRDREKCLALRVPIVKFSWTF